MPPGEAEPLVGLRRSLARTVATALVLTTLAGCGKKGPPLAPLRLVPAAAAELSARRSGDDVELRFLLPTANANGPGTIDLAKDRDLRDHDRSGGRHPAEPRPADDAACRRNDCRAAAARRG